MEEEQTATGVIPLHTTLGDIEPYLSGRTRLILRGTSQERDGTSLTAEYRSAVSEAEKVRKFGSWIAADEIEEMAALYESLGLGSSEPASS